MEESTAANKLTMVSGIHSSVSDVETYMEISENSDLKSYTLLQGANLNGGLDEGDMMSGVNGMIHLNNESHRHEPIIHIKKPCPLEMSIKAANLDTEFENESYFSSGLELQPTYGALMPGEPVQPLVLGSQKPIIGLQPAPLQVLLVQFQPQNGPISPVVSLEPEEIIATSSAVVPVAEQVESVVIKNSDSAGDSLIVDDSSSSVVEVEVVEKRKPGVESLKMKFRKVPSNSKRHKKWKAWSDSDEESLADVAKRRLTDKCCSRHCCVKVPLKKQQIARDQFTNLELASKGDLYLANCFKPVDKQSNMEELPLSPWSNSDEDISEEIANESNGNQSLSDEIQNAIKESLKDQQSSAKILTNCDWQYSIVIQNRTRIVCLKFLLSVLQIHETRLSELKKRVLNGEILDRLPVTELRSKYTKVWELAKRHLDTVSCTPLPYCKATPPHLTAYPAQPAALLVQFQEFYLREEGAAVDVSLQAYEKFLRTRKISYANENTCAWCESVTAKQKVKKKSKTPRGDVFSLMLKHLKTVPCKIPQGCCSPKPHKFFSPDCVTIPMLYEEYRKYFLKETNSELGLRYAIYESLLLRNPFFTIAEFDSTKNECPKCSLVTKRVSPTSKTKNNKKPKDRKKKKMKTTSGR